MEEKVKMTIEEGRRRYATRLKKIKSNSQSL